MTENTSTAARIPDLTGRTFIVTGASSGLGLATTRHLARHGAHIVPAVRNEAKGHRAAAEIGDVQLGASLQVRRLDLADLDSVRAFTAGVHASGLPVDVLVIARDHRPALPGQHIKRDGAEQPYGTR